MSRRRRDDDEAQLESALKKQAQEQFSTLERTLRKTKRDVSKSERIQRQVKEQVTQLRQTKAELEQIRDNLQSELAVRQTEMDALQAEMAALQMAQAQAGEQMEQVDEFQTIIEDELQKHVGQLKILNTEIENVSNEYIQLIEPETEQRNVYLEYLGELLDEAGIEDDREIKTVQDSLTTLAETKQKVEQLEVLLDTLDVNSAEFEEQLRALFSDLTEAAPAATKKTKTTAPTKKKK